VAAGLSRAAPDWQFMAGMTVRLGHWFWIRGSFRWSTPPTSARARRVRVRSACASHEADRIFRTECRAPRKRTL